MTSTAAPRTYAERVAENLRHMETPRADWKAVAPTGTEQDEEGRTFPTFDFSTLAGYTSAPTLYKGEPAAPCCQLCGRQGIKYVYHLQNDRRRWTLAVGSECVTHFEEQNGAELAKEAQDAKNLAALLAVFQTRRALIDRFSFIGCRGYGRTERVWRDSRAYKLHAQLFKITGQTDEKSGPGAITRWAKVKGPKAAELVAAARELLEA